ncbi:MAG: radical SAM protein, partial [Candidatus Lokiarchaeota archaeon]|nr:radical SAM protein [Candidatus Lokiarchaeota archaeon]MBD3341400.1 radical SAM protein [Candidatus Lokiarchaeota archaeon]
MAFRILRPDSMSVWKNEEIRRRFSYYRAILDGKKPARYIIAKSLDCPFDKQDKIEDLIQQLNQKSAEFHQLLEQDAEQIEKRKSKENSYIALAETLAKKYLEKCIFCERQCEANRISGERGYCLIDKASYVTSAFLHHGEESVLIPSGTIFFQGCNFGCVFCQNYDISQAWKGKRELEDISRKVSPEQLANLAENLEKKGALNINYVGGDPIPNIHTIISSLKYQTSNICQLWNSNFYLTENSLSLIIDFMDFWLPDFKYGNNDCAKKYSKVDNYYNILT